MLRYVVILSRCTRKNEMKKLSVCVRESEKRRKRGKKWNEKKNCANQKRQNPRRRDNNRTTRVRTCAISRIRQQIFRRTFQFVLVSFGSSQLCQRACVCECLWNGGGGMSDFFSSLRFSTSNSYQSILPAFFPFFSFCLLLLLLSLSSSSSSSLSTRTTTIQPTAPCFEIHELRAILLIRFLSISLFCSYLYDLCLTFFFYFFLSDKLCTAIHT